MSEPYDYSITSQALADLEQRVEQLTEHCVRLNEENRALQRQLQQLQRERGSLIEKHELAKNRVEAMIQRLKAMEDAP
ncbi:TIGR02449 family protein [Acidihalobacter ferrooxydans]|uniref:TIGR02449 family protein n=2 Tax=Acidihalobacter ferrooxydans TaxID=1765967 RepID=A0A1P8ULI7_9GAMM|nr:TIGR02449 family protein [Acidihalobacter ferrooxydans]APZ44696.1 TIGR02449 family protein [Acidihalobacter ferrooxydans]